MDYSKKNITMSLGKMRNLISEWFNGATDKIIISGAYDSYDRKYVIFDRNNADNVLLEKIFKVDELISDESKISTKNILNDEFRAMIVQCYCLDKQIEESKRQNEKQKQ